MTSTSPYQVVGEGSQDLVFVPGWISHVEMAWEAPALARVLRRLASFSRLILLDKRGTGLSDPVPVTQLPTLEERMDDVRAVMDAVRSERAALLGISEGGPMNLLFAATYPQRTRALVLTSTFARLAWAPDYPWGVVDEVRDAVLDRIDQGWGTGVFLSALSPRHARDDRTRQWWARYQRLAASPGAAVALLRMSFDTDVRSILPAIVVPTLVLHETGDLFAPAEHGRYLARSIPGAKYAELPGDDHFWALGDADAFLDEIEEFLTGVRHGPGADRVLATILFIDVVGSTERVAELGDRRWRELLEQYYGGVRYELGQFRGREIDTAGDGFFATFDGPARAIRCASAIIERVRTLGIEVRAGVHTGECEAVGDKVGGIAVHIGARVAAEAGAGTLFVSSTVKDLVAGSGIRFEDRGARILKGIPGEWRLFAVDQGSARNRA